MFEVKRFKKSYSVRYEEYMQIFSMFKFDAAYIQSHEVSRMWSQYLDFVVPNKWTAYWKMPRHMCADFSLPFPSDPVVEVDDINMSELTAVITIKFVDDYMRNNDLPCSVSDVPLKDLIPTVEQEDNSKFIECFADILDQYRFFYNYLWYPWDIDAQENWAGSYLEQRLKLYYDLNVTKSLHSVAEERIWNLIKEGRKLYTDIEDLKNSSGILDVDSIQENMSRLEIIKYKLNNFEDAEYRQRYSTEIGKENFNPGVNMVIQDCSINQCSDYLQSAEELFSPNQMIKLISKELQHTFTESIENDIVAVCPGSYKINSIGGLRRGGSFVGLYTENRPTVIESEPPRALIEYLGISDLVIKNIIFEIRHCKEAVIVFQGHLNITNVNFNHVYDIFGDGIFVCADGTLHAENCTFSGFKTAIICSPKSRVSLKNCVFTNNETCVLKYEGSTVSIESCTMEDNQKTLVHAD